jgi:putative SOS response-associated peptidase YedK
MCNRYRMTAKQAELAARFGVEPIYAPDESFPPPELFPKKTGWVVREQDGARRLDMMPWGFPHQVKGASGKMLDKPVTNVRNLNSPFWKSVLKTPERRCLVPVTDFCEMAGPPGKMKQHWFNVPSRAIFAFAGVWRPTPDGNVFAFLTCEPKEIVKPIHSKAMPVVLHDEDFDGWLSGEYDSVCALAAPYPSQLMMVA